MMLRALAGIFIIAVMACSHPAAAQMPYLINEDVAVLVDGSSGWTSALTVTHADQLFILAKGLSSGWSNADDWWRWYGGEGILVEEGVPGTHPLPGFPGGCLIGKIGEFGEPFYVGSFMAMEVPYDGELFLGPNDYQPGDNPGEYRVFIWTRPNPLTAAPEMGPTSTMRIGQNYPSPFSERTRLEYDVASAGPVTVRVLDVSGRVVRTLLDGDKPAGHFMVEWDGKDNQGHSMASGTYLTQVTMNGGTETSRVVLIR